MSDLFHAIFTWWEYIEDSFPAFTDSDLSLRDMGSGSGSDLHW